jgi:CoA-transferase family III
MVVRLWRESHVPKRILGRVTSLYNGPLGTLRPDIAQLAWLCGAPDSSPLLPPASLIARLDLLEAKVNAALKTQGSDEPVRWSDLVVGRAGLRSFSRQGRQSANGSCHLVTSPLGDLAVNLARPSDADLLAAALGSAPLNEPQDVLGLVERHLTPDALAMAWELGVPIARVGESRHARPSVVTTPHAQVCDTWRLEGARVVDVSSLWAGPLTARLLGVSGAEVIKVEGQGRPDGARQDSEFYRWLHEDDQACVSVDFSSAVSTDGLRHLLESADVVIESSRPRALRHVGCAPEQIEAPPGQIWLSITGYGRRDGVAHRVAFGDDAAVAAGLVVRDEDAHPMFLGDALSDPMAGMIGAIAVLEAAQRGGGVLIDVALSAVGGAPHEALPSVPTELAQAPMLPRPWD